MPNLPELVVAYYACFQTGAIAAPLNLRFKTAELAPILARLKPALYLGHGELYPWVAELDPSILASERRFVVGGETGAPRTRRWRELVANGSGQFSLPAPDPHAAALLLGTSGTTGLPKLVTHTLSTLSAIADSSAHLGVDGEQIGVAALPMVHISGVATFFGCMRFGAPVALLERFDPDAVLDAIERHQCTRLIVLPFIAVELLERQRARPRNVSLGTCRTAGDVCPPGLQENFRSVFAVPLRSFWASTEAIGAFTFGPCDGPVSAVAPGAQIQLLDDEGVPVRRGEVGELAVRGPNVAIGYWTAPGRIDDRRKDGWLLTGDLMRQDQEGNYWFVSRKKDLIIRGGSNISPVEVERALLVHPAVRDAAVVGVPDAKLGQRVAGFVQLADGAAKIALAAIQADLATRLADYNIPERWVVIDRVPRNGLGKVDRNRLLTLLQTPSDAPGAGEQMHPARESKSPHSRDRYRIVLRSR
jgi:long-chain acyl-CoA synthetase